MFTDINSFTICVLCFGTGVTDTKCGGMWNYY